MDYRIIIAMQRKQPVTFSTIYLLLEHYDSVQVDTNTYRYEQ